MGKGKKSQWGACDRNGFFMFTHESKIEERENFIILSFYHLFLVLFNIIKTCLSAS